MLAEKHTEEIDPTGYWMSEKLDGVRAYWDGSNFYSRQGIRYYAPKFFREDMPRTPLDGELWCGRGLFQKCVSIVKKKDQNVIEEDWKYVIYLVFDAPSLQALYEDRVKWLLDNIPSEKKSCYAVVVGIEKCNGQDHLNDTMKDVISLGGEGIMLRAARSNYEEGRTKTLLKVTISFDDEAKVIGHRPGEGRYAGVTGALECEIPNQVVFHVGVGFSDSQRKIPPNVGDIITFKYQELSDNGHPRFPVFLRTRVDLTWEDVCQNAKTKSFMSQKDKKFCYTRLFLLQNFGIWDHNDSHHGLAYVDCENQIMFLFMEVMTKIKSELNNNNNNSLLFSTIPSRDSNDDKMVTEQDDDFAAETLGKDQILLSKGDANGDIKPCIFGATCTRKNKDHLDQFTHTEPSTNTTTTLTTATATTTTT
jgi:DNA ligase-1